MIAQQAALAGRGLGEDRLIKLKTVEIRVEIFQFDTTNKSNI